ncbi:MAG: DNA translocase FtsK [Actinobacteria bacterium]|nr:MAG: DNA translocase FtsK [Actinomycetota bacterium]
MAKRKKRIRKKKANKKQTRGLYDIYSLLTFAGAFLALIFIYTKTTGVVGSYINIALKYGFGGGRYLMPFFLAAMALYFMLSKSKQYSRFGTGLSISFLSILAISHTTVGLKNTFKPHYLMENGGIAGALFAYSFKFLIGPGASYVIFSFAFIVGALLLTNKTLPELWKNTKTGVITLKEKVDKNSPSEELTQKVEEIKKIAVNTKAIEPQFDFEPVRHKKTGEEIEAEKVKKEESFKLPPVSIFSTTDGSKSKGKKSVKENIKVLEKTLSDFAGDAGVSKVVTGPTVTRYEIHLASGVKVNRILSLADDIALAFASPDVRILAPIPGKSAIGVEVPNIHRELVTIGDILTSPKMKENNSALSIVIGKDISGHPTIANLADMPHLLIAGATGSGKSVCINSLIATILSRATPSMVKMILIDPKRVELNMFNGIPHLLTPVVTQAKQAAHALEWVVSEMESRYELLAANRVKNIAGYNNKMSKKGSNTMPYIIVIIDELADLMMVAAREVEDAICRLAQLARAVGVHLIVATQRPSTDVITGLIKANITHRIAFAVSSQIDSRVILDSGGAEKLVGKGDMLFSTPQTIKPKRIQAAFITEKEIENLCTFIKSQSEPEYVQDITTPKRTQYSLDDFEDELYDSAVEIVVSSKKASVSYLQRRLRIGYGRAARLMDMLEDKGIVGPQEGSKPREVHIDEEELSTLRSDE